MSIDVTSLVRPLQKSASTDLISQLNLISGYSEDIASPLPENNIVCVFLLLILLSDLSRCSARPAWCRRSPALRPAGRRCWWRVRGPGPAAGPADWAAGPTTAWSAPPGCRTAGCWARWRSPPPRAGWRRWGPPWQAGRASPVGLQANSKNTKTKQLIQMKRDKEWGSLHFVSS